MESNVDDATRASAAALMKHSPQQQEKVSVSTSIWDNAQSDNLIRYMTVAHCLKEKVLPSASSESVVAMPKRTRSRNQRNTKNTQQTRLLERLLASIDQTW